MIFEKNRGSCACYGQRSFDIADFHSHLLPGIDDGARDSEESLQMLSAAWEQGVRHMVASPHFYADREDPDSFLERRARAVSRLITGGYRQENGYPAVYLGAEVAFFNGMSRYLRLSELCIGGGRAILIEMPFERWSESAIAEVLELRDALGLRPVIAHIERYIGYQRGNTLGRLIDGGVLIQSNAEYFTEKKTARKAMKLLLRGGIHLLGSDAHGLSDRAPNMGEGIGIIAAHKYGEPLLDDIERCSKYALRDASPLRAEVSRETVSV